MRVEIWSDVVCPWCYVGKRRFEHALADFEHRADVDVHWRSFELDPAAPAIREGDPVQRLVDKYGMSRAQAVAAEARLTDLAAAEGLDFHLDTARSGNTFDAHRLLHLAADNDKQDAVKERFMRAYFTEGEAIGDHATLTRIAVDAGLDESEVKAVLTSDWYASDVRADEEQAAAYGISGVPFFVIDGRYGISGAQSSDVIVSTLRTAYAEANPLTMVAANGSTDGSCEGDNCAV
ncbi:MAG TPA: DsbA family oxidoreductase [Acidothermaceae bacterium]|jgi:predicted DsbA family dithiol-disulfide isomerase|nr:DsbA family oxidoreductase [Acidothermaceae bacterium]